MAALPTNATGRLVFNYTGGSNQHSIMLRLAPEADPLPVMYAFDDLLTANSTCQTEDVLYTSALFYAAGENFSIELPWLPHGMTGGSPEPGAFNPRFVSFIARTAGGRRCRFFWYGLAGVPTAINDYRLQTGDVPRWDEMFSDFKQLVTTYDVVGIDGLALTFKGYMNTAYNSYFQRKQRG